MFLKSLIKKKSISKRLSNKIYQVYGCKSGPDLRLPKIIGFGCSNLNAGRYSFGLYSNQNQADT